MKPTALIADDEPLLAEDLRRRLARLWPELDIVAVCHDGPAALARLGEDRPEIAFLDIRMPGLTGLEVAARLDYPCQLVFVTAYDQHAVEAFEQAAVDYVLKPAEDARSDAARSASITTISLAGRPMRTSSAAAWWPAPP